MTNEGTFPKIDGDVLYASEVNTLYNYNKNLFVENLGSILLSNGIYKNTNNTAVLPGPNNIQTNITTKAYIPLLQNIAYSYSTTGFTATSGLGWDDTALGDLANSKDNNPATATTAALSTTDIVGGSNFYNLSFGGAKNLIGFFISGNLYVTGLSEYGNLPLGRFVPTNGSSITDIRISTHRQDTSGTILYSVSYDGVNFNAVGSNIQFAATNQTLTKTGITIYDVYPFFSGTSVLLGTGSISSNNNITAGSYWVLYGSGTNDGKLLWTQTYY